MTTTMIYDECAPITEQQFKACEAAAKKILRKERALLMADAMVRSTLDGSKTQTRRIAANAKRCPYGTVGDVLWIREAWCQPDPSDRSVVYRADIPEDEIQVVSELRSECGPGSFVPWRPSIHMPRWACRITLEITDVRLQNLWEITDEDVAAEGVKPFVGDVQLVRDGKAHAPTPGIVAPRYRFQLIWDSNHVGRKLCAWKDNPLVWALTFKRLTP